VDGNELTDDSKIESEDHMEMMNRCDGVIWDECPYTNHRLRLKIRQVAHNQMVEVLTLVKKKIDLASTVYRNTYLDIFKALIVKWIASKKTDTLTTTPSVTNIDGYMERNLETPQRQLK
jgi:hypothetical protein